MKKLITSLSIAALCSVAMPIFAESAPVFDADSMPQQFDGGSDTNQPDVLPPAPGQEGTFVPTRSSSGSSSSGGTGGSDGRIKRIEQQINNLQNSDVSNRVEALQNQVQTLRGQVEQLTHQLQQTQEQQKVMFTDVDKRLTQVRQAAAASARVGALKQADKSIDKPANKLADKSVDKSTDEKSAEKTIEKTEVAATATSAAEPTTTDGQPDVAEEQQIYQTAYALIKAKKYEEAVNVLQGMLKKYPSGQFASNAHYWLGELYGLMNKNDQALAEFTTVVKDYSDSPRISDAQLKMGLILASQLKWPEAKTALKSVINHYPGTASARLASDQLKQIKQAGH